MKNTEAIDHFDQANSAEIEKLFWIAGSFESHELCSFLEDMDDQAWKESLPEVFDNNHFKSYQEDGELNQLLLEENKLGFIAQVTFPEAYDFYYETDQLKGYSSHPGIRRIKYVYAETPEVLLQKVEITGQRVLDEDREYDRRKKNQELQKTPQA